MPKVSRSMLVLFSMQLTQIMAFRDDASQVEQASMSTEGEWVWPWETETDLSIDISGAIGSGSAGVGPLVKDKDDSSNWAPWGLSLSGNGMMAEAAAAGTFRVLSETSILDQLASISSVSGGSWFSAQFAYSRKYSKGVVDTGTPIEKWYTGYLQEAMNAMMQTMQTSKGTWEEMIAGMYVGYDKGMKDVPANNTNRAGNAHADLLICTTLNGQSVLSDNSTVVQFSSAGGDAFFSNPAFWLVPTSGTEEWRVPGVDLKSAKWTAGDHSTGDVAKVLPSPTVTKVSAMSSAGAGASSNPALLAASNKLQPLSKGLSTQNPLNGVCTTPDLTCEFPSMMAIDGCYVDNLGFALNVGYLQKKYPGKNLRVMGVSSELCDRSTDPMCLAAVNISAYRSLFADAPFSSIEGYFPDLIAGPSRQIFKESITTEQALGQQTGYGGMSFMTGTFTTVQNDHFGVAAGTKVTILILNVNGPTYLQPAGPGVPAGGLEGLATVARNAYNSMKDLLTAYHRNDKVSSDKAFLYYQSVLNAESDASE